MDKKFSILQVKSDIMAEKIYNHTSTVAMNLFFTYHISHVIVHVLVVIHALSIQCILSLYYKFLKANYKKRTYHKFLMQTQDNRILF